MCDGIEFSCMTRYVCIPMPLFNARAHVYALPHTHFLTAMPLDKHQSCDFEGSSAQLRPEFIFPCEGRSMHINPAIQQLLINLLTAFLLPFNPHACMLRGLCTATGRRSSPMCSCQRLVATGLILSRLLQPLKFACAHSNDASEGWYWHAYRNWATPKVHPGWLD